MLRGWSIGLPPCHWWSRFDVSHRRRFWTRHRLRAYIQFGPAVLPYRNHLSGLPHGGFLGDLRTGHRVQQMIGHSRSQGRCNERSNNYSNIHEKVIFKGSVEERPCYLRMLLRTRSVCKDVVDCEANWKIHLCTMQGAGQAFTLLVQGGHSAER